MNKILIAAPIHNRGWILPNYLSHIYNISYEKSNIHLYFLINNSTDDSFQLLKEFKKKHNHEYASINIENHQTEYKFTDDRTTKIRTIYTYNHLSELRNNILDYAKKLKVSHLLSVDSDILVPSDIIEKLLSANKPIVSSIIYNGYKAAPNEPWRYPNIMDINSDGKIEHISNWYVKNAPDIEHSKIIPVDITGAVYLISKDVVNSGVRYGFHIQGEDVTFSLDAKTKGFNSFCELFCFSNHIMDEEYLDKYLKNNTNIKGEPL